MRQVFRLPSYRCKLDLITFSFIIRSVWKKPWYLLRNSGFSHLQAHYSIDRLKPCLPGKTESVGESLASEKEGSCLVEPEKIYLVQNMSLLPSDTNLAFLTLIHSGFVVMPTSNAVVVSITMSCLTLWSHGLKHVSLLCTPDFPRICSDSWPLNQWCYLTISSSVIPFSFCSRSFPASQSFLMSWLFTASDQNIGASASASALQMNIQGLCPLRLIGLTSLQSKGLSRVFFSTTVQKHHFFMVQLLYPYMNTWKTIALTIQCFVRKVTSLLFLSSLCSNFSISLFCCCFS